MAKYELTSGKEVLARVIRASGGKIPSMYHDDILEWISEGLGMMQVTNSLIIQSTADEGETGESLVCNHCTDLPCGFVSIIAIEDCNGNRMYDAGNQFTNNLDSTFYNSNARVSSFEVNPYQHQVSTGLPPNSPGVNPPYYINVSDIKQSSTNPSNSYYTLAGNKIQTSFEKGFVKIHYYAIPTGEDGYPLIPNNENFKEGLMWHVMKRLIGAGYEHKVFNYQMADAQCELFMGRGMGEVSFYTPEGAARINKSFVRLIPAPDYRQEFFD